MGLGLEGFAFRVGLGPAVFALSAVAVLILAALANPVDALRQE